MDRNEKAEVVKDLSEKFSRAKIAVVADYKGLTVSKFEQLRVALRQCNAEVKVAKNTLMRRAVEGTTFEPLTEYLVGTSSLTLSYDDPVSPAKILVDYAKDNDKIEIRGGVLDGKSLSKDDITALSKLPSKEVLLGQLLSVMQAVPTSFVLVLNAIPLKLLYALQAIRDQKAQADN